MSDSEDFEDAVDTLDSDGLEEETFSSQTLCQQLGASAQTGFATPSSNRDAPSEKWETCIDENDQVYFYQPSTGQSSWGLKTGAEWELVVVNADDGTNPSPYWYNSATNTSQWESPDHAVPLGTQTPVTPLDLLVGEADATPGKRSCSSTSIRTADEERAERNAIRVAQEEYRDVEAAQQQRDLSFMSSLLETETTLSELAAARQEIATLRAAMLQSSGKEGAASSTETNETEVVLARQQRARDAAIIVRLEEQVAALRNKAKQQRLAVKRATAVAAAPNALLKNRDETIKSLQSDLQEAKAHIKELQAAKERKDIALEHAAAAHKAERESAAALHSRDEHIFGLQQRLYDEAVAALKKKTEEAAAMQVARDDALAAVDAAKASSVVGASALKSRDERIEKLQRRFSTLQNTDSKRDQGCNKMQREESAAANALNTAFDPNSAEQNISTESLTLLENELQDVVRALKESKVAHEKDKKDLLGKIETANEAVLVAKQELESAEIEFKGQLRTANDELQKSQSESCAAIKSMNEAVSALSAQKESFAVEISMARRAATAAALELNDTRASLKAAENTRAILLKAIERTLNELESTDEALAVCSDAPDAVAQTLVACARRTMLRVHKSAQAVAIARAKSDAMTCELDAAQVKICETEALRGAAEAQVSGLKARADREINRRITAMEKLLDLQGNVRVFCRVRPPLPWETLPPPHGSNLAKFDPSIDISITFPFENEVAITRRECGELRRTILGSLDEVKSVEHFEFDAVLPPGSTQADLATELRPSIGSFVRGHDVCIMAYGQTGSGKTYSMEGEKNRENRGLIPRVGVEIFERLAADPQTARGPTGDEGAGGSPKERAKQGSSLTVSAFEIYNEHVYDLLVERPRILKRSDWNSLTVQNDPHKLGAVSLPGLTSMKCESAQKLATILDSCRRNRAVGCTDMNTHSSRSHLIIMLTLEKVILANDDRKNMQRQTSTMALVDLAGCERVKKSHAKGLRLEEAKNINRSLSALGDVISALGKSDKLRIVTTANVGGSSSGNHINHIPYRNSKLTHVLQGVLREGSRVVMIVTASPCRLDLIETSSALSFAQRCRALCLGPSVRKAEAEELLRLKRTIALLRRKLHAEPEPVAVNK